MNQSEAQAVESSSGSEQGQNNGRRSRGYQGRLQISETPVPANNASAGDDLASYSPHATSATSQTQSAGGERRRKPAGRRRAMSTATAAAMCPQLRRQPW